ncbi:MAG TPA: hypothetical protein VGK02_00815 [Candidatus Aquicultor sp.]
MPISQIRIGAIFVGWITSLFIILLAAATIVAGLIATGFDFANPSGGIHAPSSLFLSLIIFLSVFIAFFAGGYVTGRMAAFAGSVNGGMLVLTTIVTMSFAVLFIAIVERRLGFDLIGPATRAIAPFGFRIFAGVVFALVGSMLGGRYGEGYVDRLDLALNVTKPMPKKQRENEPAKSNRAKPSTVAKLDANGSSRQTKQQKKAV